MAENRIKWTEQQQEAINASGGDVLVTASAGTGKTAVLSGRCVRIVSDKTICPDVRNVLVLTFTEAAAEQMRSRIAEQLKDAFLQNRDSHLRRQLMLLQGADISTIHSFCKRLITEYFYKLDLDPTFAVIDADEQNLLKSEVLDQTLDWAWQQESIRGALERLLRGRDLRATGGFPARIVEVNNFLDGVISRRDWYDRAARLAEAADPFATDLGEKQKHIIGSKLQHILAQIRYAIELYESQGTNSNWATKWQETFVRPIENYLALIDSGDWKKFCEEIAAYERPSQFKYKPRDLSGVLAETIKALAEGARKSFDKLFDLAILNPDYTDRLGDSVRLQTTVLVELVRAFERLYTEAKRAINCLDFADLEHYALKLLTKADEPGPSEIALLLRQRYKHVFVDEYQDINAVQQAILDMLSPGGNTLGVGDIKQSIYAFRGAQPDIFLQRLKRVTAESGASPQGSRVDLNANFRSAKPILDFVNKIFSRIMTASSALIDYDESARLRPGPLDANAPQTAENGRSAIEFHVLDEAAIDNEPQNGRGSEGEGEEIEGLDVISARQRQAAMIAKRIRQMVGADTGRAEFQIYDKQRDVRRDVEYRDIVVLMRSLAKKANDYVELFRLAGVPVSCQATAGYFEATEITDLLALLKVLDNPQRDIELAAVLRIPFFKVSDTELAKIKIHSQAGGPQSTYYDHLLRHCRGGDDAELVRKLKTVLAQIEQWRTAARRDSLADLIWRIYRQTNFLSFVSALPSGQARRANLLKLHDRAIQFEGFASSAGVPSLTRFVAFIEELQEAGQDWAPAEPQASAGNAVRILSVHKSKGLEFPVVFLAELESSFNHRDVQSDCLADADDTLGLQIIDPQSNTKVASLAHQVIAERKLSTSLAEEMRILYVATTRAKDRLILTASQKHTTAKRIVSNGFLLGDKPIPDWQLRACRSPLEWVLYGLSDQKVLHDAFETGLSEEAADEDLFSFRLHGQAELKPLSEFVIGLKSGKSARRRESPQKVRADRKESSLFAQIKKSLSWSYRFSDAPLLPAKSSVTQLTHNNDEYVQRDYGRSLERRPAAVVTAEPDPSERFDARLIGTATHLVLSQLNITAPVTTEAIAKTRARLVADGAIAAAVAERIDTTSILDFFRSELAAWAFDASHTVWREWPFTFALPASELAGTSDETVVVQGIIDLLVRTAEGLIVIDFKTDRIAAEQVEQRAEFYRRQLELYSRAACAILKVKPAGRYLYFLTPGICVEV
jgi:ATP-dependent helicase/nuclease subunit A